MIRNFSASYAGHVVDENIGLAGTPANDRWYTNDQLVETFDWALDISTHLEKIGFQEFWMAEHHFQPEGYEAIPNLLMLGLYLSTQTDKLRFGCGFNIVPMWHPLRLAEDFAMADHLTKGRVLFGIGRGYHSREVETFGNPSTAIDNDANRELFEEQTEVLFKAFNQRSFSHHGEQYDIPPAVPYRGYDLKEITLVPRPRTLPVECWQPVVSASQRAMDFMVKHGIKGIIGGGAASGGTTDRVMEQWRDTLAQAGRETELGGDLTIGYTIHLADTEEQAIKEARLYFEENMKMFAPLGFVRGLTSQQISDLADPSKARSAGLPTLEQAVESGAWLCGPPESIIEKIQDVQERYPGLESINVGSVIGTPQKVILEQLEWFGKEVMPKFTG